MYLLHLRSFYAIKCLLTCLLTVDGFSECTDTQLAYVKETYKNSICVLSEEQMVEVFQDLGEDMADADMAAKLQGAFLAAGGCESKAAKLLFEFACSLVDLRPDAEKLTCYLRRFAAKYPSLAAVLYENVEVVATSYDK